MEDGVDRAVAWLRSTVKLLAVMPWLVAGVLAVLGAVVSTSGSRWVLLGAMALGAVSVGFMLPSGLRQVSRTDRPAWWGGPVTLAFTSGTCVVWTGLMVLLWQITAGVVWLLVVAVATGLVVVAVVWHWRFHGNAVNAAFGAVPRHELVETSTEIPFYAPRSRIVLGIGRDAVVIGSPSTSPGDDEKSRNWADLHQVNRSEFHHDDSFTVGRRTWRVKSGVVVCLRFVDGEVWPIPVDDPEGFAELVRARAGLGA